MTEIQAQAIETILTEERRYPPPPEFAAQANAQPDIYEREFEEFWETEGRERISWEGEPVGELRTITFADLQREVVRVANALKTLGVRKGTPVGIYMGMVPELPIARLACARLGAPHTIVFGGFSAESLSGRLNDMECELLITQDEGWRRGTRVPLKKNADEALEQAPTVRQVVVYRRTGGDVEMREGRDFDWGVHGEPSDPASCPCEPMDSEDLLYLLYTSDTTTLADPAVVEEIRDRAATERTEE